MAIQASIPEQLIQQLEFVIDTEGAIGSKRDDLRIEGWRLGQMSEFSLLITFMAMQVPLFSGEVVILIQVATVLTILGSSSIVVLNFPTPAAVGRRLRRD